jgi:hypothetical protein
MWFAKKYILKIIKTLFIVKGRNMYKLSKNVLFLETIKIKF